MAKYSGLFGEVSDKNMQDLLGQIRSFKEEYINACQSDLAGDKNAFRRVNLIRDNIQILLPYVKKHQAIRFSKDLRVLDRDKYRAAWDSISEKQGTSLAKIRAAQMGEDANKSDIKSAKDKILGIHGKMLISIFKSVDAYNLNNYVLSGQHTQIASQGQNLFEPIAQITSEHIKIVMEMKSQREDKNKKEFTYENRIDGDCRTIDIITC